MTDDADRELVLVGDHAEVLESGAPLAPGDRVLESDLADLDRYLIDEGRLRDVSDFAPTVLTGDALEQRAQELDVKGRSKMSADELRDAVAAAEAALPPADPTTASTEGGAS